MRRQEQTIDFSRERTFTFQIVVLRIAFVKSVPFFSWVSKALFHIMSSNSVFHLTNQSFCNIFGVLILQKRPQKTTFIFYSDHSLIVFWRFFGADLLTWVRVKQPCVIFQQANFGSMDDIYEDTENGAKVSYVSQSKASIQTSQRTLWK